MTRSPDTTRSEAPDWDAMYRTGTPPWETGLPAGELIRVLDEGIVQPGSVLEVGCGTGADSVCLAKRRFDVTAIDSSPTALDRARTRAEQEDALIRFVLDDVFRFARKVQPYDFVYDAGFYHFIRQLDLTQYLDLLWRVTRPGSYYLALVGNAEEQIEGGPPAVSEQEVRLELGRLLEFVHLRRFRFESSNRKEGYLGWSCLMRRPIAR